MTPIRQKINIKYILITLIAVISSWLLHEFAHWIAGEMLGYQMSMTLNTTYPSSGKYLLQEHYVMISAAGPIVTIIEAIIIFMILKRKRQIILYPFLFTCFYMRFFATVISFKNPNDEARISSFLGLGKFTLPILVSIFLFYLIYIISKHFRLELKFNLLTFALILLFSSVLILANQFFKPLLL